MRARGQGVLTLDPAGLIVLGALGPRSTRHEVARPGRSRARPRAEPGSAPTGAGPIGTPPLYPGQPGRRRRRRPPHQLGRGGFQARGHRDRPRRRRGAGRGPCLRAWILELRGVLRRLDRRRLGHPGWRRGRDRDRRRALRARRRSIVVLRGCQHGPGRTGIPGGDEPVRCRRGVRRRHLRGGPRAGSRLRPHGLLLTTGPQRRHQVERLRRRRIGAGRRGPDLDRPGGGGHHGRVERIGDHQRVRLARHLGCGLHAACARAPVSRSCRSPFPPNAGASPGACCSPTSSLAPSGSSPAPRSSPPRRRSSRWSSNVDASIDLSVQEGDQVDRGASVPAGWATTTLRPPAPSNPPPPGSSRPPWPASRPEPSLLIANPGDVDAVVTLRLLPLDRGEPDEVTVRVPAASLGEAPADFLADAPDASVLVTSDGAPIVALGSTTSLGTKGLSVFGSAMGVPIPPPNG